MNYVRLLSETAGFVSIEGGENYADYFISTPTSEKFAFKGTL